MPPFNHQHVLIVGGTSGFGLAVAEAVVKGGGQVTLIGRTAAHLEQAVTKLGAADGVLLDATDAAALRAWLATQGQFDHVVSTLGGASSGGFLSDSLANINAAMTGKFTANLQLARLVMPHLTATGSLTLTSGTGGSPATAAGAVVGNHAVNLLVQGLAIEAAPRRVNAVAPTWTPTGLWRDLSAATVQSTAAAVGQATPLGRVASVFEVAAGFVFLMQNQFTTGVILPVDGGVAAQ